MTTGKMVPHKTRSRTTTAFIDAVPGSGISKGNGIGCQGNVHTPISMSVVFPIVTEVNEIK